MTDILISVRLSAGTYTARARGERTTASSTISADAAASRIGQQAGGRGAAARPIRSQSLQHRFKRSIHGPAGQAMPSTTAVQNGSSNL